jgi:hypothetical protein
MSFILKTNPTVINIKLTNIGRQLLSQGQLTFDKWAVGDSEIDYGFNTSIGFDSFRANILRPKDGNPKFLSYILRDANDSTSNFTSLPSVVSNTNIITNTATERGFFSISSGSTKILTDPIHCKQPDMQINIADATGGTKVRIRKSPTYIANINEPIVGDYVLVKWANPIITSGTVKPNVDQVVPYLWYKIHAKTGTLSANNLVVTFDRPTPNFNGLGGSVASGAFCYPNNNNREVSGDSIQTYYSAPYVTDFIDDSVIAFLENCICPTQDVPVWNMNIVFTEEVVGVTSNSRNISQYYSKTYGGFIRYIERIAPTVKKIGIIHFSNASPSNHYGEGLFENTPVLDLPTIMWHYETGGTIGLKLTSEFQQQILSDLNTPYRNLVDRFGNIVGKVFNDLKVFVIEDQELLFAMTYKGNRNWTLPRPILGLNVSMCDPCNLIIKSIVATADNGSGNGTITITVDNTVGSILYSINNGVTYIGSNVFLGLVGGNTYNVKVIDTGVNNCNQSQTINVPLVLPTTVAPTTPAPTTPAPTTPAPTTPAPTTPAPTTVAPTTPAPTTEAPTTPAPTTVAPTTPAPTTVAPTTPAPTTVAPLIPPNPISCGINSGLADTYLTLSSSKTFGPYYFDMGTGSGTATLLCFPLSGGMRFTIREFSTNNLVASSGWIGIANYPGPWGGSLNTGTGQQPLNFTKTLTEQYYSMTVETITGPSTTVGWNSQMNCVVVPTTPAPTTLAPTIPTVSVDFAIQGGGNRWSVRFDNNNGNIRNFTNLSGVGTSIVRTLLNVDGTMTILVTKTAPNNIATDLVLIKPQINGIDGATTTYNIGDVCSPTTINLTGIVDGDNIILFLSEG